MKIIGVLLLVVVLEASQYVPIPSAKHGLLYGDTNGQFEMTAFYDLLCPDSKQSFMSIKKAMSEMPKNIKLQIVFVPLPYHIFAFKVHQGYQYIKQKLGNDEALSYMEMIFQYQDLFQESKWKQFSIDEFIDNLSQNIAQSFKVDRSLVKKALEAGSEEDFKMRGEWKYATGSHSVSGTPFYYANGVRIDGAEDKGDQDWTAFFRKYLHK